MQPCHAVLCAGLTIMTRQCTCVIMRSSYGITLIFHVPLCIVRANNVTAIMNDGMMWCACFDHNDITVSLWSNISFTLCIVRGNDVTANKILF
jgi:hypothetical protein